MTKPLTITFTGDRASMIRFAATLNGLAPAEIVAKALDALREQDSLRHHRALNPWKPVPIFTVYKGVQTDALYLPATRRVTITSGPATGAKFSSGSAAARAVVAATNPDMGFSPRSGWRFWRLVETGERLEVLRPKPPAPRKAPAPR